MGFNLLQGTFDFGGIEEENQAEELKNDSLEFSDEEVVELIPDWKEKNKDRALENYRQAKEFEEEQRELREYTEDSVDYSDEELEAMLEEQSEYTEESVDYSDEELEAMLEEEQMEEEQNFELEGQDVELKGLSRDDGRIEDEQNFELEGLSEDNEQINDEQDIELEGLSENQDENNLDDDEYYLKMLEEDSGSDDEDSLEADEYYLKMLEEETEEPGDDAEEPGDDIEELEDDAEEPGDDIDSSIAEYTDEYFESILDEVDDEEELEDDAEEPGDDIDSSIAEYTDEYFESILDEVDDEEELGEDSDYTDDNFEGMLRDEEEEDFLDKELKSLQVEVKEEGSGSKAASNVSREGCGDTAKPTVEVNKLTSANTHTTSEIQGNISEKDHPENKGNDFLISDERRDMLFYIKQLELEKSMLEQKIEVERLKNQMNTGGKSNENETVTNSAIGGSGSSDDNATKAVQHKSSLSRVVKKPSKKLVSISDFDKMNEDTLIKYVESYMRKQGVRNDLVDKKLLIEKFGAGNVKRLISKNMLIPFKNGFSLGV